MAYRTLPGILGLLPALAALLAAALPARADSVLFIGNSFTFADKSPVHYFRHDAGKVDLWAYDNYHGSMYGYYLEALTVFGDVTGLDPRSLGCGERCADELGISPDQAAALQKIASDELTQDSHLTLKPFTPGPKGP